MSRHLGLALLLSVALAGPAAAQEVTVIEQAGPFTHRASGTIFPEEVAGFRRASIVRYDSRGDDVSATYNLFGPKGRLVLTVYVHPAPPVPSNAGSAEAKAATCASSFDGAAAAITQNPAVRVVEQGDAPFVEGVDRPLRRRALYTSRTKFDGKEGQDVRSELDLYCYVEGRWLVKYRATSPASYDATSDINDFIRRGPWPGRRL